MYILFTYDIYIYNVHNRQLTWTIPVAGIHIEVKKYLTYMQGTDMLPTVVQNMLPTVFQNMWSTLRFGPIRLSYYHVINILPKDCTLLAYRNQTCEKTVIEFEFSEFLKQSRSHAIPAPIHWRRPLGWCLRHGSRDPLNGQKAIDGGTTAPHQTCVYTIST